MVWKVSGLSDNLKSFWWSEKSLIMLKVFNLCIRLVWLCQHKLVMMLQKQHISLWIWDQIAISCIFLSRKTIYALFGRKNDLRTSSGKFLQVEFCHSESSDFSGLWGRGHRAIVSFHSLKLFSRAWACTLRAQGLLLAEGGGGRLFGASAGFFLRKLL